MLHIFPVYIHVVALRIEVETTFSQNETTLLLVPRVEREVKNSLLTVIA